MIEIQTKSLLDSYFQKRNVEIEIAKMARPVTPIRDLLFPPSSRKQKASVDIAISEMKNALGAVPVVKRGAMSYPVSEGEETNVIRPEGFRASSFLSAVQANNFAGDAASFNALLNEKVENLRDRISVSTEILCAQSLTGKISYPLSAQGGMDTYSVELGKAKTAAACDIAGKQIGDVQKELELQYLEQVKTGAAGNVAFLAGTEAYAALATIAAGASKNAPVVWNDAGFTLFGKYKIIPTAQTYSLPNANEATPVIDAKTIKTIDLSNAGTLFYLALDDFDARLAATPFFAKYVKRDDPSGYKIIAMSKPLPALAVSRTVDKKYLA